ncbi:MAG: hypothetical protein HYV62_06325 [Candidatus Rokubacteria bacterium]|nr:hypothetical protein [Candidatus Rokubacteria bacterium]
MVWYGWLGLGVLLLDEALLPWRLEPLVRWFTPTMWTAYILVADALVLRRRGASLIHDRPREAAFMATASIPLWLVFEAYNWRLQNWAYFGVPEPAWLAALGYAWSFATITPGLYQTAALLEAFAVFAGARGPVRPPAPGLLRASVAVGAAFLVIPPLLPASVRPWTFGFVWLGFILFLDPLNHRAGRPSFTGAWARGDRGFVYRWLLAGLVCGFLWEFWNYWATARWTYVGVPVFPDWKIFEMPLAGYLGFPPFALEAFAMYHFVRPLAGLPASRHSSS